MNLAKMLWNCARNGGSVSQEGLKSKIDEDVEAWVRGQGQKERKQDGVGGNWRDDLTGGSTL